MLKEEDILPDLEKYRQYLHDILAEKNEDERIELSKNNDAPESPLIGFAGIFLHSAFFIAIGFSSFLRINKFVIFFAKLRIATDKF